MMYAALPGATRYPKAKKSRSAPISRIGLPTGRRRMSASCLTQIFRFQPLTVQMMMAAFTNLETVHIDAFALLSKTLACPKPSSKPFATMPRCAPGPITWCRDRRRHGAHARQCSVLSRHGLFASFVLLFNFPRHNKVNGVGADCQLAGA
jgi:hypothetical protein